uniref:Uncharacterized protein n=1 Tax=Oryza brachyantha TaxID=4533 RepID=J3LD27_ORYBR
MAEALSRRGDAATVRAGVRRGGRRRRRDVRGARAAVASRRAEVGLGHSHMQYAPPAPSTSPRIHSPISTNPNSFPGNAFQPFCPSLLCLISEGLE